MNCPHCGRFNGPDLEPGGISICFLCGEFSTVPSDCRRLVAVSSSFLARVLPYSEVKRLLAIQRAVIGKIAAGATKN